MYRQTSTIRRAKSQELNISRLVLQLLPKSGVKSRMKKYLEQRRQAMLQLHLGDQQFTLANSVCLLGLI